MQFFKGYNPLIMPVLHFSGQKYFPRSTLSFTEMCGWIFNSHTSSRTQRAWSSVLLSESLWSSPLSSVSEYWMQSSTERSSWDAESGCSVESTSARQTPRCQISVVICAQQPSTRAPAEHVQNHPWIGSSASSFVNCTVAKYILLLECLDARRSRTRSLCVAHSSTMNSNSCSSRIEGFKCSKMYPLACFIWWLPSKNAWGPPLIQCSHFTETDVAHVFCWQGRKNNHTSVVFLPLRLSRSRSHLL